MTDSCRLPQFSEDRIVRILDSLFGIQGEIKQLDGERDLNFLVRGEAGPVVLKISNQQEQRGMLECQYQVFELLAEQSPDHHCPRYVCSKQGNIIESVTSDSGIKHLCRCVSYIEGMLLSQMHPHSHELLQSVGLTIGAITKVIFRYEHPAIERPLLWNMMEGGDSLHKFKPLITEPHKSQLISYFEQRFKTHVVDQVRIENGLLRCGLIHNDANDNNIVINGDQPWEQTAKGLIDFGDMVYSWLAVEPAVAAAYAILDKPRPLEVACSVIKGFHQAFPLTETEISVLFEMIAMRLCMSVCICAHQKSLEPDNKYLEISEQAAWDALEKLKQINADFAHFAFRDACGLEPVPLNTRLLPAFENVSSRCKSIVDVDLIHDPVLLMDTSVSSPHLGNPSLGYDPVAATKDVFRALEDSNCLAGIGKYDEYRLIYDSEDFIDFTGHQRTLHLGIDVFMPAGSRVFAPLDGKVFALCNNTSKFDYGGSIILQHRIGSDAGDNADDITFYTLYGHLRAESFTHLHKGMSVKAGKMIALMGDIEENGYWPPHVHFEIITDLIGQTETFVGVGSHHYRNVWKSICPDPNLILGIPEDKLGGPVRSATEIHWQISNSRDLHLAPSLSLSYRSPIHIARGGMQYLYDYTGRCYLDAVNNVPHVGHCHPVVVQAAREQSGVLNTNTRYLYGQIQHYSERLLQKFPDPLNVCFLVNSGSEANDLALRLATNFTGRQQKVVIDHAYHGNLNSLIEISPYKHNGKGGMGTPQHVHVAKMPDLFRNNTEQTLTTQDYVDRVEQQLQNADSMGGCALFIAESILGCGGQVVLPDGYLKAVYKLVRDRGGVCIADEVQVGFGRVGSHFWAFETQRVIPDIVTLGKPIGNGHPLAAVITTSEIAQAFNNGMEYFNTFGGNPVSCAIGNAVLDVMEGEGLQQNALKTGQRFLSQLEQLKNTFPVIGDVRGLGLFIGIELVTDRHTLTPAARQASYIVERMKQEGILTSTDGPLHNVIKIKPPLCFNQNNVDQFVNTLTKILSEPFSQIDS